MKKTVLMIVDVQNALVNENPYELQTLLGSIKQLAENARRNGTDIVYVRHDDGVGTEFEVGTESWQIHHSIEPREDEKIVDKQFNSAFHKTNLHEYLKAQGVGRIVLTGMQTEYCIDATLRSAFDLGYKVIIPKGCHSSFDNDVLKAENLIDYYERRIWNGRYADVMPLEAVMEAL